jgi:hypothetical protein
MLYSSMPNISSPGTAAVWGPCLACQDGLGLHFHTTAWAQARTNLPLGLLRSARFDRLWLRLAAGETVANCYFLVFAGHT